MALLKRLAQIGPQRIGGQIVLLVVISVMVFHLVSISVLRIVGQGQPRSEIAAPMLADRFEDYVRFLDRLGPVLRAEAIGLMRENAPALALTLTPPPSGAVLSARPGSASGLLDTLRARLGPDLPLVAPQGERPADEDLERVAVRLRDGAVVSATLKRLDGPPPRPGPLVILGSTLTFLGLALTLLLIWATRALTQPLDGLARAAEEFALDSDPAPLPEEGPAEMQGLARALNRMQTRIRSMMRDRTRMLAAVGHDLRTPITRMRLRTEFVEDEALRRALLRDLEQMSAMVEAALAYLRDGNAGEPAEAADIAALLQTIADDFSDMGGEVRYEGPARFVGAVRSADLSRAVTNLVDNALVHGRPPVVIALVPTSGQGCAIDVLDHGPGIAAEDRERLVEPFARGDEARTHGHETGLGLGLSIARAVAQAHRGELMLSRGDGPADRPGLRARMTLTLGAPAQTSR